MNRFFLVLFLLISGSSTLTHAQRYKILPHPEKQGRKLIRFEPIRQQAALVNQTVNMLDAEPGFKRPAIPFRPFEMVNPKTGRAINPDAKLILKAKDQRTRTITAKQFFNELNELERQLCLRGHSLRLKDALTGMRVQPLNKIPTGHLPAMNAGFVTKSIQFDKPMADKGGPNKNFIPIMPTQPITGKTVGLSNLSLVEWEAGLYISESTPHFGSTEFPVNWVYVNIPSAGRKQFPLLLEVSKGIDQLSAKAVWQVSAQPFENTLKTNNPPLVASGTQAPLRWAPVYAGMETKKKPNTMFAGMIVDLSSIPDPSPESKIYYARVALYNAAGDLLKYSRSVGLIYGGKKETVTVPIVHTNTVPGFRYSFPENQDIPFGLYVRGNGIQSKKIEQAGEQGISVNGYKVTADAALGFRYYNFMNLVDKTEPKSKELDVIRATLSAISGIQTGADMQNETKMQGVNLVVNALDGYYKDTVNLVSNLPGTGISLNYDVEQSLDKEVLSTRFMIGPVPVKIAAGFQGKAGLEINGYADIAAKNISGSVRPYLSSKFYASGGVDAVIAYATLNAALDPLLEISLPVSFNSAGASTLSFNGNIKALYGKVYLKVGFYYPCPDLEKIVGWLSGDEEVPLCECNWEFNIFDFDGLQHTWGY